jgi:hypothetical protein
MTAGDVATAKMASATAKVATAVSSGHSAGRHRRFFRIEVFLAP